MEAKDLKTATDHYKTVINSSLMDERHPFRCSSLIGLGRAHKHGKKPEDAMVCFQTAASFVYAIPFERMTACFNWEEVEGANLIEVYKNMLDIMPRLVGLEQTLPRRIKNVKLVYNLAQKATVAAINGNNLLLALELAEMCRGNIFRSAFEVRTLLVNPEFLELQNTSEYAAHASSLMQAVKNLNQTSSLLVLGPSLKDTEQEIQQQHHKGAKYANEIRKVRDIPQFKNFLQPISKKLIQAAKHSHIVVVNAHKDRWDALVIKHMEDKPQHIAFQVRDGVYSALRAQYIRFDLERRKQEEKRGLLKEVIDTEIRTILISLWSDIVTPILQHLGLKEVDPTLSVEKLARITWCVTGELAFVPIHAAGNYNSDNPEERLFHHAISSYAPTISSLLASYNLAPSPPSESQKLFIAAMSITPGLPSLRGTELEMKSISHIADANGTPYTACLDKQATIQSVLAGLRDSTSVHLACHGTQDTDNPLASCFALNDGNLTVEKLLELEFKTKDLAFLSACETAKGDTKMPNETIHLSLIMMLLGFRAVIGSMWALNDACATVLTEEFYKRVIKGSKIDLTRVPIALHLAISHVRDKYGEDQFHRWCPIVHFGAQLSE